MVKHAPLQEVSSSFANERNTDFVAREAAQQAARQAIRELHFLTRKYGCRLTPFIIKVEKRRGRGESLRTLMQALCVSTIGELLKTAKCSSDVQVATLRGEKVFLTPQEVSTEYGISDVVITKLREHGCGGKIDGRESLRFWWMQQYPLNAVCLTIRGCAERYQLSHNTVRNWVDMYYLRPVRFCQQGSRGRPARVIAAEDIMYLIEHPPLRSSKKVMRRVMRFAKYAGL